MDLPDFTNRHGERLDSTFHPGSKGDCLLVLGHGVTGNKDRELLVAVAEGLAAKGWPVLRFSFSGNGDSGGAFEEATISKECDDLRDVLAALPEDLKVAYAGHSMGGAVGVMTAAEESRIQVLISLAGMVRTEDFCEREFGDLAPDDSNMWDEDGCPLSQEFVDDMGSIGDVFAEVGSLAVPYLLIHGADDDVVLPEDSEDALATADEPKKLVWIEGAGHLFEETGYEEIVQEMDRWLAEYLK